VKQKIIKKRVALHRVEDQLLCRNRLRLRSAHMSVAKPLIDPIQQKIQAEEAKSAINCRLQSQKLNAHEKDYFPESYRTRFVEEYIRIRNHILHKWCLRPTQLLLKHEVYETVASNSRAFVDEIFDYLNRFGHINFGIIPSASPTTSISSVSKEFNNMDIKKKKVVI
ncbi:hypothetical protein AKO1_004308, partial [Acrasis kona]